MPGLDLDNDNSAAASVSVVASRLPFAIETENKDEVEAEEVPVRVGQWASRKGATVYTIAVTKKYLVVGTEDGTILWLSANTFRVAHAHRPDKSNDVLSTLGLLEFSPAYTSIVSLNMKGQLFASRIVGNPERIELDHGEDKPLLESVQVCLLNLGHLYER
jgi:hypothetical protein